MSHVVLCKWTFVDLIHFDGGQHHVEYRAGPIYFMGKRFAYGGQIVQGKRRQRGRAKIVGNRQLVAVEKCRDIFVDSLRLIADREQRSTHLVGDAGGNCHRIEQAVFDNRDRDDAKADRDEQHARRVKLEAVITQIVNGCKKIREYASDAQTQPDALIRRRGFLLKQGDIEAAADHHYGLQHMNRMERPCLWIVSPKILIVAGNEEIAADQEECQDRGYSIRQIHQMAFIRAIRDFRQEMVQAGRQEQDQEIAELDQEHRHAWRVNLEKHSPGTLPKRRNHAQRRKADADAGKALCTKYVQAVTQKNGCD